jgi:hypothetical protein
MLKPRASRRTKAGAGGTPSGPAAQPASTTDDDNNISRRLNKDFLFSAGRQITKTKQEIKRG